MKYYKSLRLEYKIAFIISAALLLCTAFTAYYVDFQSLSVWSLYIWDTLYATGNPTHFYAHAAQNIWHAPHGTVGSDALIYIPWAIWNFPMWILQRFFGCNLMENPLMQLYSKCFLLLLIFGSAMIFKKITKLFPISEDHANNCVFLFFSGFFTLLSTAYIGQNDILVVFVLLLAMYALLSGKWKTFLFWAALSIAFKPYFIFPYIAIILFKEKRIHYILWYGIVGMSIYMGQKLPFLNAPMYQESFSGGATHMILRLMIENSINFTPHMVSLFVLCLLGVYVLAYFSESGENSNEQVIYYALLPYICFFLFVRYESYRPLYLFVFMALMIMAKPVYYRINLLLEIVASACLMYYYLYNGGCFFDGQYLLLPGAHDSYISLSAFVKSHIATSYNTVCMAVFLLCLLIFAVINHPGFRLQNKALVMKEERYIIVLRSCFFALPFLAAVLLRYF